MNSKRFSSTLLLVLLFTIGVLNKNITYGLSETNDVASSPQKPLVDDSVVVDELSDNSIDEQNETTIESTTDADSSFSLFEYYNDNSESVKIISSTKDYDEIITDSSELVLLQIIRNETLDCTDDNDSAACDKDFASFYVQASNDHSISSFATLAVTSDVSLLSGLSITNIKKYPVFLLYNSPTAFNPYTKKKYRTSPPLEFQINFAGVNIKALKAELKRALTKTNVKKNAEVQDLTTEEEETKVVLVSSYVTPSPMYHSIANSMTDIKFYQYKLEDVGDTDVSALPFSSTDGGEVLAPSLHVFHQRKWHSFNPETHGDLKSKSNIVEFINSVVNKTDGSSSAATDSNAAVVTMNRDELEAAIMKFPSTRWLVLSTNVEEESEDLIKEVNKLDSLWRHKYGPIMRAVSVRDAEGNNDDGSAPYYYTAIYPKQNNNVMEKKKVSSVSEGLEALSASFPNTVVGELRSSTELQEYLGVAEIQNKVPVIIMKKTSSEASLMIKALQVQKESKAMIVSFGNPPQEVMDSLQVTSLPAIAVMVKSPEVHENKQKVNYSVLQYNKAALGPYSYETLSKFVDLIHEQGGFGSEDDDVTSEQSFDSTSSSGASTTNTAVIHNMDDLTTQEKFTHTCKGICVLGVFQNDDQSLFQNLVNDAADKFPFSSYIKVSDVQSKCAVKTWLAQNFALDSVINVPTLIVYSAKKNRFAMHVGVLTLESAHEFLQSVLTGKLSTQATLSPGISIEEAAIVAEKECAVANETDASEEEEEDISDLMAEILQEEADAKLEMEEQLKLDAAKLAAEEKEKADAAAAKKKKKKKKKRRRKSQPKDEL